MTDIPAIPGVTMGEQIGMGTFGRVFRGLQEGTGRHVAVKVTPLRARGEDLSAADQERLQREPQVLAQLRHRNIAQVFCAGRTQTHSYLVQELIEGRPLSQELRERLYELDEAVALLGGVLDGLAHTHDKDITHRDIKPGNIMVREGTRTDAVLIDFGTARTADSTLTEFGCQIMTPSYGSPEQCRGEVVDKRTDIYSAGATLYHMLTGSPPFTGSPEHLFRQIMYSDFNPVTQQRPHLPPALDTVMRCAMAKNPQHRYKSAQQFLQKLKRAADQGPTTEDDTIIWYSRSRPPSRAPAGTARAPAQPRWLLPPTDERRPAETWWQSLQEWLMD